MPLARTSTFNVDTAGRGAVAVTTTEPQVNADNRGLK